MEQPLHRLAKTVQCTKRKGPGPCFKLTSHHCTEGFSWAVRGGICTLSTAPLTLNCPIADVYRKRAWMKEESTWMPGQVSGPASVLDLNDHQYLIRSGHCNDMIFFPYLCEKFSPLSTLEGWKVWVRVSSLPSKETLCPWYRYHSVCQNSNKWISCQTLRTVSQSARIREVMTVKQGHGTYAVVRTRRQVPCGRKQNLDVVASRSRFYL